MLLRPSSASLALGLALVLLALLAAHPGGATSATFTDIASSAGVENLAGVGDPLNPLPPPPITNLTWGEYVATMHMWGGVAVDDFNRDGYPDFYVTNDGPNGLFRNNGDWTFTEVAASAGVATPGRSMGAAWGDYDNDGCRDLFVANFDGPSTLYHANCDGTFSNATAAANITLNFRAAGIAWGDYDRDGFLDLIVSCYIVCPNVLLHNNGDGTFADTTAEAMVADRGWTFQPVWVDYDQDGDLDLWDVNDFGPDRLYRNNDNGTFTEVSRLLGVDREGAGGMGLAIGDIDNDGWLDFFVTNYYNDSLYRSTHGGLDESFTGSVLNDPLVGWGTEFFDAENDGDLDLFIANGFIFEQTHDKFQDDKLLENLGRGIFVNASGALGSARGGVSHGMATADFDLDGDLDLFIYNISGPSMLLRNDGPKGNYLKLNLTGSVSNRDAVGALVNVTAGGKTFLRCITAGASYLSQSDHVLLFGLGNATTVDRITVDWPSGARQVLTNITANLTLNLAEPPSLIARAGGDYVGRPGIPVDLDGSTSTDPLDGLFPAGANFTWTIDLGGVPAVLYGASPNITLTSSGGYKGSLRVLDSLGNFDDDLFIIYIRDERPPTVRAGPDIITCDSAAFTLSGAGSFDNDPAFSFLGNYTWSFPLVTGPVEHFGTAVTVRISIPGVYNVTLTARDPTGNEGTDGVVVLVTDCTAPQISMPSTMAVVEGAEVRLVANATDSSLDFATAANFSWTFLYGGVEQTLYGRDFAHRFVVPGIFQVTLAARDSAGNEARAVLVIVVADVTPPTPAAADLISGDEGTLLRFDASNSTDNDPTFPATGTFTWVVMVPASGGGTTPILLYGATPVYSFFTPGRFPYTLSLNDRSGNAATLAGNVSVRDRTPPRVQAGQNLEVTAGSTVMFLATATDNDPSFSTDPARSRYEWSFEYGGVRVPLEGAQPTFRFEQPGVYIVTLTVTDAAGNSASDHMDVRVVSGAPDPRPLYHRILVAALIAGVALAAIPYWRRARAAARDSEDAGE